MRAGQATCQRLQAVVRNGLGPLNVANKRAINLIYEWCKFSLILQLQPGMFSQNDFDWLAILFWLKAAGAVNEGSTWFDQQHCLPQQL